HISTDYFKAIGTPLREGRTFELTDRVGTPAVTVVNEELARLNWPGESAIGKTIMLGSTPVQIIGVVGSVRQRGLAEPLEPAMYVHGLQARFGAIGLTLGALGIFGVLAYAVNQRRQEIGVRVALGATPRAVLGLIVGRGMLLASAGVVFGLLGASLLTRSMQSVLYDIQPSDPVTFSEVVIVLLGASLLASWLPARRALSIDPVTALRYD